LKFNASSDEEKANRDQESHSIIFFNDSINYKSIGKNLNHKMLNLLNYNKVSTAINLQRCEKKCFVGPATFLPCVEWNLRKMGADMTRLKGNTNKPQHKISISITGI